MRTFLFPGQGSQAVGMGKELAAASPHARAVFQEVDEALGQHLFRLMTDGPPAELMLTANAQPAIMAHAMAVLRVLEIEGGISVAANADYVAGHSLGEYSALCAAGYFELGMTACLLKLRGESMQAAAPVGVGAMAVLLGADIERADSLCAAALAGGVADEVCAVANDNDPGQVVISGHATAIERAVGLAKEHGIKRGIILPVSAPFHCTLMAPAADAMEAVLAETTVEPMLVPLIANVTAAPVSEKWEVKRLLVEQVTGRVRWRESMAALWELGVTDFVELGGKVLSPMVKRTVPDANTISVMSMDDIEALLKAM